MHLQVLGKWEVVSRIRLWRARSLTDLSVRDDDFAGMRGTTLGYSTAVGDKVATT